MTYLRRIVVAMVLWATWMSAAVAADAFPLAIDWPSGWGSQRTVRVPEALLLRAEHPGPRGKQVLELNVFEATSGGSGPAAGRSIRATAELLLEATVALGVAEPPQLLPLKRGDGYYFIATDPPVRKREFRHLIQGVFQATHYVVHFMLMTDDATSADAAAILRALEEARVRSFPGPSTTTSEGRP